MLKHAFSRRAVCAFIAVALLIVLAVGSAFAAAEYFARYEYAFSPEALAAASAAEPPEEMNESDLDIFRLGFAAGFDQAIGNNAFAHGISAPADGEAADPDAPSQTYIVNRSSKVFHFPVCSGAQAIKETNKMVFVGSREELIDRGFHPCGNCQP